MDLIKRTIRDKAPFLFSFVFSKASVFLIPLLMAEILTKENFGILEYALAGLGMVLKSTLNLGVPGAYPFFKLRKKNLKILNGFTIHYLWLLVFFIGNQLAYYFFNLSVEYYMALNVSYIIANQVFISTQLKTVGAISKAVLFDSGIYLTLLVFIVLNASGFVDSTLGNINFCIQFYAIIYAINALTKLTKVKRSMFLKYIEIIKFSYHLLFASILIFFITVSGRLLIEYFFNDFEIVGIYAFYFRLAALVVMIYQVISIAFFKDIYTLDPKILDKYFSYFFVGLYVISTVAFILSKSIVPYFSDFYVSTIDNYDGVYFILSSQVVFWISSALMSNITDREELAKRITPLFLVLILLFLLVLYLIQDFLTLRVYTMIHFVVFLIATLLQILVLYRKKIVFKRSAISLSLIFSITLMIYFVKYSVGT
ncbi:hypothetical protein [Aquimarina sp. MMG016]|uniref:hypothetical protein n=1 Tax=Aquimarina sp. MMG016 TaxID=2822690 RepID=UPI001B3A2697|nr:hypothetical protein [Aquimarina sp. MMG016]MBQ4820088.1 hypothetical protein [Aquimarina sp. MMG016]